jgi:uncharacterized Zn-binding protein involved in type VI secretion
MTQMSRRQFVAIPLIAALGVALSGCVGFRDDMTIEEIIAMLKGQQADDSDGDSETNGPVKLTVKYPAGRSPNVFTSGWVFGASCLSSGQDISNQIQWSGTASFNPGVGATTRPVFNSEGANRLTISVTVGGKKYEKSVNVNAVSPGGYAAIGDQAQAPADAHGCPACPHPVIGPITTGSPNVLVNGRPAARVGDRGVHAACCGSNTFEITSGDSSVLVNGRAAARTGKRDTTRHCGGSGHII